MSKPWSEGDEQVSHLLDMEYLRDHLESAKFRPFPWDGEDKNLRAFSSKEALVAWYWQTPGVDGEPYRDRGFYCRELAHLSRTVQPRVVVEFGTSLGIGACLLKWLNPQARVVTVDRFWETYLPGDSKVRMGHLARLQDLGIEFRHGRSWEFELSGVDLCFVDGDHSYDAVSMDSYQAYKNAATDGHAAAIVWHDYNERHPGVVRAVSEFCEESLLTMRSRADSDTVWVTL